MATYTITKQNEIEIDFHGVKLDYATRNKMKAVRIWWNPDKKIWHGPVDDQTLAVTKEICGEISVSVTPAPAPKRSIRKAPADDYALKVKIRDIISADKSQLESWEKQLKDHVNEVMGEDNASHSGNSVSKTQESVWMNCFRFIAKNLSGLNSEHQEYELIFEYSLPGTVHERPDVFLLTDRKAISLEFKRKEAPQMTGNKDDVAQAIRYKEWLENHHLVTRERNLIVNSYLVCTHKNVVTGALRDIEVLTKDNFCSAIARELSGENHCSFIDEWLSSRKTEMPDMLQAIEIMYREGRIPYISDVNKKCLDTVLKYIEKAKREHKKILILINGVPQERLLLVKV